jgi:hypothetical protein
VVSLVVAVLHELEGLEVRAGRVEALEKESARLDASDNGVAGYGGGLRGSCLTEAFAPRFVGDGGVGEGSFSGGLLVVVWKVRGRGEGKRGNERDLLKVGAF